MERCGDEGCGGFGDFQDRPFEVSRQPLRDEEASISTHRTALKVLIIVGLVRIKHGQTPIGVPDLSYVTMGLVRIEITMLERWKGLDNHPSTGPMVGIYPVTPNKR